MQSQFEESAFNNSRHQSTDANVNLFGSPSTLVPRSCDLQLPQLSPTALAYLGDAVYELYIRTCYLLPPKRSRTYHHLVVAQVKAETQAQHLRSLTSYLTPDELEIVRRGRNAVKSCPKRLEAEIYQQASSLETLIGYLYLTDPPRLEELLQKLQLA